MDRALFYGLLLCTTVPLTVWGLYRVSGTDGAVVAHPVTTICMLALTGYVPLVWFRRLRNESSARSLGCQAAPCYPHKDPILGLDTLTRSLRALKRGLLLEELQARFAAVAHTYWFLSQGQWLLVTDEPENVKTIHATDFETWPIAGPRQDAVIGVLGPQSIFSSNGETWRTARHMIRPSFVRDQVADLACFNRHVSNLVKRIPTDGSTVDMQDLLMKMTMDSSTDFMLGFSTNCLTTPAKEALAFVKAFEYVSADASRLRLGPLMRLVPNPRYKESMAQVHSFLESYMRAAVAESATGKKERSYVFFDELIKSDAPYEYIRDQVLSIIIAGRDTTAGVLSAVFWFLARNPDVVRRLRREIVDLGEANPDWEQLKSMTYLSHILKESLRLFPPVATNSRQANKDTVLPKGGGPDGQAPVFVPKGTPTRYSLHSMQRRKDLYGEDAEEFRPERWETLRPGWEFLPFSGGPRICLGQQFALTQMSMTLFRVLQNFESIEARDENTMRTRAALTFTLQNGCKIAFKSAQTAQEM